MATWTAPTTRASGALITATIWNTDLVENLKYLKDAPVIDTAVILGAATTSGIRLDLESGTLAVREGDDSAYAPLIASVINIPSAGSINFASSDVTITHSTNTLAFAGASTGYTFADGPVTVALGAVGTPSLTFSGDLNTGIWSPAADTVAASTGGTERMRITSAGDVGINCTPSGNSNLQISTSGYQRNAFEVWYGSSNNLPFAIGVDNAGGNAYIGWNFKQGASSAQSYLVSNHATKLVSSGGGFNFFTAASGTAGNAITFTERFAVLNGGDLAIGATAKLYLDGVAGTGDTYIYEQAANTLDLVAGGVNIIRCTTTGALINNTKNLTIGATAKLYLDGGGDTYITESTGNNIAFVTAGTTWWTINGAGAIVSSNNPNGETGVPVIDGGGLYMTTWKTTASAANANVANSNYIKLVSSLRGIKYDIESIPLDVAKRTVMELRSVTYRSRVDDDKRLWAGFIAEEVEQANASLATYTDAGLLQSVTYDRVPAYLLPVVQNHEHIIATLERKIAALEARLN